MGSIAKNSWDFIAGIQKGLWLECNEKGKWWTVNVFTRWVRWLWNGDRDRMERIGKQFIKALDHLEKRADFVHSAHDYIKCGEEILKQTKMGDIAWRVAALRYRIGKSAGGLDPVEASSVSELESQAIEWKKTEEIYKKKELIEEEKGQLKAVSRYPELVRIILDQGNEKLRKRFFRWALRDACDVDAFAYFPAVVQRLKRTRLDARIGYFGIKIYDKDLKTCTLPIEVQGEKALEVKRYSLLDETQEVVLRNNYRLKISEIFNNLEQGRLRPANFEFFGTRRLESGKILEPALINYNALHCASYDPKIKGFAKIFDAEGNFEKRPNGLPKQLLPIEIIDKQRLKLVYGVEDIPKNGSLISRRAVRKHDDLDFADCHAFRDFIVPEQEGKFEVYPTGKTTDKWPETLYQKLTFLGGTHRARLACPDAAYFSSDRQHAKESHVANELQTATFAEKTVEKLRKGEAGTWYYQFPAKNCAYDTDSIIGKSMHPESEKHLRRKIRAFRMNFNDVTSKNWFFRFWFRLIKIGGYTGAVAMRLFRFMAGTWRGLNIEKKQKKVFMSVEKFRLLTEKNMISSPALLVDKAFQETGSSIRATAGNFSALQN